MDTGVVKRQVYFAYFSSSNSLQLFEGPENRLRPFFRHSSISSGMMTVVGKMVGHSIVMVVKGASSIMGIECDSVLWYVVTDPGSQ